MAEQDIPSTVPGKLKLLIVNISGNVHGNEESVATNLYNQLKWAGVDLAANTIVAADSLEVLSEVCKRDFNALLLVSHADKPDAIFAQEVNLGGNDTATWHVLTRLGLPLADKLLALCVCHSHNQEMIGEMYAGESMALIVVGPTTTLSGPEALDFFKAFFTDLSKCSQNQIDPFDVARLTICHNRLASDKMKSHP